MMAEPVELEFRRAAKRLLPREARLAVAVSGGGDSVALLHLLHRYAAGGRPSLAVAHLDHGLRRGSRADRSFVERLSRKLALPCFVERREVGALRRKSESPEEAARRVRREFLVEAASASRAEWVVLGHTLDDQAETVLMRLARGAGATALTGMAERGPGPFVRPLVGLEREVLRSWLRRRRLAFREDPSNRDLRFDRNRVRRLVLPVIQQALNPRAARHIVKAAELLRSDAVYLDELALRAFRRLSSRDRGGRLALDVRRLARTAPTLARRVLRLALHDAGVDHRRVAARHVQALLDLAGGAGSREIHLPGRIRARRVRDAIVVHREARG